MGHSHSERNRRRVLGYGFFRFDQIGITWMKIGTPDLPLKLVLFIKNKGSDEPLVTISKWIR